ncbi:uncharacterized protein BXIN_1888 [Babesia sp. Xinjiang]|uniref:uncharacterized protein n=1 Tax=Babesia sp. Xinjiang TaxID=462227 RepID=UPI000A252ACD|nr:uncharacterized protein BXIN_1888 [Babesia sp. Xinjiang]ORM40336.1 hypothetical protein BXIN_1888 [Babesia sp. Xinjiang]
MTNVSGESDPVSATGLGPERVFYRPDRSMYVTRTKAINEKDMAAMTAGWPLSATDGELGSTLDGEFAWQKKWYLRFVPPKSAEELQIGQYWRYDGPRLENFITNTPEKPTAEEEMLTPTPIAGLKSMATKILSGIPQETLAANSYRTACESKSSVAAREKAGSTVSSQLKMPESQGGTKRSILAAYTIEKNKAAKKNKT